jgi:hypothetical protein
MSELKPGMDAPLSAQYVAVGPRGGRGDTEITAVKGKPMPPTPRPNMTYVPVDVTKHKRK